MARSFLKGRILERYNILTRRRSLRDDIPWRCGNQSDSPNTWIQNIVEHSEPATNGSLVIGERVVSETHARIEILQGRICNHRVFNAGEAGVCAVVDNRMEIVANLHWV